MRQIFMILFFFALITLLFYSPFSTATTITTNYFYQSGGGNSSGSYALSPPSINFTPIPNPSMPSFPVIWVNFSFFWITVNLSIPNIADLPGFFLAFTTYIFEWIGVQIMNGILYVVQAIYLVFAYIEYWILLMFVDISNSLGVFALPVIVSLLIMIAIVIRLVIGLAKDVTIVLGVS